VKQSACVAHTNGKRFVAAEGPTSIGPQWERSPKDLKGNIYRILVLPGERAINLDVLKKVEQWVEQGLTVMGARPHRASGLIHYPESDREVEEIAEKMWGRTNGTTITEHRYGSGRVIRR